MKRLALASFLLGATIGQAQTNVAWSPVSTPTAPVATLPTAPAATLSAVPAPSTTTFAPTALPASTFVESPRGLFESDRAFDGFIGPITNPILTKDPRSLTEARVLFVHNEIPQANSLLGGGDAQVYAMQVRVALTDRLTFIADKDGYLSLNSRNVNTDGFLNLGAGLKYTLIRDVENQFLVTVGAMYELPTGEASAFQNHGSGVITGFGVVGKEFGCWHVVANAGYQFGLQDRQNSSFFYGQLHIDRQLFGWLYPLAEINCFAYNSGGDRLPNALGEGDGLLNLGTQGVAGNVFVTAALGLKARLSPNVEFGAAWETPLGRKDIMLQRLVAELILRY
jgi:hypothetical protein